MDIVSFRTFLAVKNVLNFTIAAKELGYAQSTVSAQIKQLEEELGYPLFERHGKRIFLSSRGGQFAPIAEDILSLYSKARMLQDNPLEVSGTLCVGILESLLATFTEKTIPEFSRRYKNVNLKIFVSNREELTSMLNLGQIDIAYISSTSAETAGFRCFSLRTEELVFVASAQNPLCKLDLVDIDSILRFPIITTEENGVCYLNLKEIAADRGVSIQNLMQINNTNAICQLIRNSDSVAFLPAYSVKQRVEKGVLKILRTNIPTREYFIKILSRKNKWIEPYMEDMIKAIHDSFAS